MAKIKNVIKDSNRYIKVKASFKENFDVKCLNGVKENKNIHKLLSIEGKISKKKFKYKDTNRTVSLDDYLKNRISKNDFYMMMEHFVCLYRESRQFGFDIRDVVLDLRYIYINPGVMEIRFVYMPIKNKNSGADLLETMINITEVSCSGEDESVKNCVQNFYYFLKELKEFDDEIIEKYIVQAAPEVIERLKGRGYIQRDNKIKEKGHTETYWESYERTTAEHGTDMDECIRPVLTGTDAETYDKPVVNGTELDKENELPYFKNTPSGTEISEDISFTVSNNGNHYTENREEPVSAMLYRVSTKSDININNKVFAIGSDGSRCDYCVMDNPSVAGHHADIINKEQRYYVYDKDSPNRTFVNGNSIPPRREIEIHGGDSLILGNEEFIFKICQL